MNVLDIIEEFCLPENMDTGHGPSEGFHISNRANLITKILSRNRISHSIDFFEVDGRLLTNIYVSFGQDKSTAIVLDAHHDIANPHSLNIQDNTASVVNLLCLADKLKIVSNDLLSKEIILCFTDGEEITVGGCGSGAAKASEYLREKKDVEYILALELTANGDCMWAASETTHPIIDDFVIKGCPVNNSSIYSMMGYNSACIGILPSEQINDGFPEIWKVCHSQKDNKRGLDITSMNNFIDLLYNRLVSTVDIEVIKDENADTITN